MPICRKLSLDSLEVGEDDQTDDQGDNRQTMTQYGQVVDSDGKLWERNGFNMMNSDKFTP